MPDISKLNGVARRELTIFYVLDTSGSMSGTPIAKLNAAMTETVNALKQVAQNNADAVLKIAVMEYNSDCSWITSNGPEELEDFFWQNLQAGGTTEVGSALEELNEKMSRNEFLQSMTGAYLPVVIFMTDGYPTDNYDRQLAKIKQNKWFARATKIGFAIGDDADVKMVSEIVGNSEAVISTDDLDLFARLIKFASVTASMLASQSKTSDSVVSGASIIQQYKDNNPDDAASLPQVSYSSNTQTQTQSDPDDGWGDDWN